MKSLYLLFSSLFLINLTFGQKAEVIIVGPQNGCNSGVSKNIHTDIKYIDVDGYKRLKITTLQHRTYDNSKIYNAIDGNLIWEWKGESSSETWYSREHFINIDASRIRIEFKQGFSDPFCNGYVKVEKIKDEDRGNSSILANSEAVTPTSTNSSRSSLVLDNSQIRKSYSGSSGNFIQYDCNTCKEALRLYQLGVDKRINFPIYEVSRMRALVSRCIYQFEKSNLSFNCNLTSEYEKLKSTYIYPYAPRKNQAGEEWRFNQETAEIFASYNLPFERIISEFKSVIERELVSCQDCLASLNELYDLYSYQKENTSENRYISKKVDPVINKFKRCLNQGVWLDMVERDKSKSCKVTKSVQEKFDELRSLNPADSRLKYFRPDYNKYSLHPPLLGYGNGWGKFNDFTYISSMREAGDSIYKTGVFDKNGFGFIKPRFDKLEPIYFGGDLYFITKVDIKPLEFLTNCGLINVNDSIILPPVFENYIMPGIRTLSSAELNTFGIQSNVVNNAIFFKKEGKWSILSKESKQLLQTDYIDITFDFSYKQFKDGAVPYPFVHAIKYFKNDSLYGFLNFKGEEITPPLFSRIDENELRNIFSAKAIKVVKKSSRYGLLDENYKQILEPEYDEIGYSLELNRSEILVDSLFPIKKSGKYGYISETGRLVIQPICDTIINFNTKSSLNFALYKVSKKFGLIALQSGKFISDPVFDSVYPYPGSKNIFIAKKSNGFNLLKGNGDFIDNNLYENLGDFSWNGVAALRKGQYYVFLDTNGNALSSIKADIVVRQPAGSFIFKSLGKFGLVSNYGKEVVKPVYDSLVPSRSALYFYFRSGSLWGLIDNYYKIVIPPSFQSISESDDDYKLFIVKKAGKYGLINLENKQLVPCNCEVLETSSSTAYCLNGSRIKLFSVIDGKYLPDFDRILKNSLTRRDLYSNSYQEVICKLPIKLPVTTWKLVDNRSFCNWCGAKYKPYEILTEAEIEKEKYYRCNLYFEELLDRHFSSGYVDKEHKDHDNKRVKDLLVKNFGALSSMEELAMAYGSFNMSLANYMAGVLDNVKNMFGGGGESKLAIDKSKLVGTVSAFSITSDFCSQRCEYEYKRANRN